MRRTLAVLAVLLADGCSDDATPTADMLVQRDISRADTVDARGGDTARPLETSSDAVHSDVGSPDALTCFELSLDPNLPLAIDGTFSASSAMWRRPHDDPPICPATALTPAGKADVPFVVYAFCNGDSEPHTFDFEMLSQVGPKGEPALDDPYLFLYSGQGIPADPKQCLAVNDDIPNALTTKDSEITSVKVPPGGTAAVSTRIRPLRRGRFELDRISVRIAGPLGLGARQRDVPLATVLRVHPAFRSAQEAELRIRRARILEVGMRSARGLGGGTDFEQLREYGPDDEFRRIDWTATARVGKPIVRTYRAERNQRVLVLLDNGRVMAGRVGGVPRVEHAMDAAMMLTAVATRLGDRCGLVAFDREVRAVVPPARHTDQLGRVTEAMYALEPVLSESDYSGAFAEVVARFRRRAMLVVLSDLLEQAVSDSLMPALPLITRTHLVVVAGVRDPAVGAWAADPVHGDEEAFRRVAAISATANRRRTAARLRSLGALVVDAEPGDLAVELADTYLRVKSTGRL